MHPKYKLKLRMFLFIFLLLMFGNNPHPVAHANGTIPSAATLPSSTTEVSLKVGETAPLFLSADLIDPSSLRSILVEHPEIASIDETGAVTGLSIGSTRITGTLADGQTIQYTITVTSDAASIHILYLKNQTCRLAVGQTRRIHYQVTPEQVTDTPMLWTCENTDIAEVDQTGLITAKSPGTAHIVLRSADGNQAESRITVLVEGRMRQNTSTENGLTIVNTARSRYTYKEMQEDLNLLQDRYGDCIRLTTLGRTYDKRTLSMVILGNPDASKKILIQSSIHGREYMTAQLTMKQIEFYCRNYYSGIYRNRYFSEIFEDTAFYIVPMSNPDGVTISQYGLEGISNGTLRRNLRTMCDRFAGGSQFYFTQWKSNARGVDLNRNFAAYWPYLLIRSKSPSAYFYKGKEPESEIETQTLVQLVNTIHPSATISYHATGSILFWDYGQNGWLRTSSYSLVNAIHDLTGYSTIHGFNKKFSTGFSDWVSVKKHTPAVTIEIGTGRCPLKSSEFSAIWKQNKMLYVTLTELQ